MALQDVQLEQRTVRLKVLPTKAAWESLLLPVSGFPMAPEERAIVGSFVSSVATAVSASARLVAEVFIQFTQLHIEDGGSLLSDHARGWKPQIGLGVWPDREPPTLWNKEDFERLPVGARPRQLSYQVFRIIASEPARTEARDVMFGRGNTLQILTEDSSENFFEKSKSLLLASIQEKSFRSFPFYVPLLERKSLNSSTSDSLQSWLCGASAYIRESSEDKGILIVSREPLTPILEQLGGRYEPEPEPHWQISA